MPMASPGRPSRWCGVLCFRPTDLTEPHQSIPIPTLRGGETVAHRRTDRSSSPSLCCCARGALVPLSPGFKPEKLLGVARTYHCHLLVLTLGSWGF